MQGKILATLVILGLCSTGLYAQNASADYVPHFPWWGPYNNFDAYSGMLSIRNGTGLLHYVFVTSQQNKSTDPVVLWLNGGPGCSSLLGLISENGPFNIPDGQSNFTQTPNPWSWNTVANVLYLETPVGVGFSQNFAANYTYNDTNTAADNWAALVQFFERFPQYKDRKFFITGESYAGMYIPYTSQYIIQQNAVKGNPQINLKGIMVGNGVFNISTLENSTNWFFDYQNFYGPNLANIWETNCQTDPKGAKCAFFENESDKILYGVDPYDIYGQCWGGFDLSKNFHPRFKRMAKKHNVGDGGAPCADFTPFSNYFNTPYVKQALHVPENVTWEACSDIDYNIDPQGSFPCYLNTLFKTKDLNILIYSGDIDGVVPYLDTLLSIDYLEAKSNGKRTVDWHQWKYPGNQVGGQAVQYSNLQFTTIRAAGHQVPTSQPAAAFFMFNQTLNGIPL